MADQFSWDLSEIRTEFRRLTGLGTTGEMSDVECNKWINDYYTKHFPHEAQVPQFNIFVTQALSATDDGEYTLNADIERLDEPVTVNGDEINFYRNPEQFFKDYPDEEQYITVPTLVIGTGDTTKVKHSAFDYDISGESYSKASSEVALTGVAVSSGKYGAWSLKINAAGTITVAQADSSSSSKVIGSDLNEYSCIVAHTADAAKRPVTGADYATYWSATGNTGTAETWVTGTSYQIASVDFDTPFLALDALSNSDSDSAYMGFVTVTKSDGAFTPATTALDASNVTDTYTDGRFDLRNTPESMTLYGSKMYVRPKADDIYQLKAPSIGDRPAAFTGDSDVPEDLQWGSQLAIGAAKRYTKSVGDAERTAELEATENDYLPEIRAARVKRLLGQQVQRSF